MTEWESVDISEDEIRRQLEERGFKAGRGDSPYTQENYERIFGLRDYRQEIEDIEKKGDPVILAVRDGDRYSDFGFNMSSIRSSMRPEIRKHGLPKEIGIAAMANAFFLHWHSMDPEAQKERIGWVLLNAVESGFDCRYDGEPIVPSDIPMDVRSLTQYTEKAAHAVIRQENRFIVLDGEDFDREFYELRHLMFRAAYVCLCTDEPMAAFGRLCRMMDMYGRIYVRDRG